MSERQGCCTTCDGFGRDASSPESGGKCWDCYGTGHCHMPDPTCGTTCRAGCPTKDHATWGDCARAARIQVDRAALAKGRT